MKTNKGKNKSNKVNPLDNEMQRQEMGAKYGGKTGKSEAESVNEEISERAKSAQPEQGNDMRTSSKNLGQSMGSEKFGNKDDNQSTGDANRMNV